MESVNYKNKNILAKFNQTTFLGECFKICFIFLLSILAFVNLLLSNFLSAYKKIGLEIQIHKCKKVITL